VLSSVYLLIPAGIGIGAIQIGKTIGSGISAILICGALLLFIIAQFALSIKRLHDLDKSAWLVLLTFIPIIDIIFPFYLLLRRGTKGKNKYGVQPKEASKLEYILVPFFIIANIALAIIFTIVKSALEQNV
jgi:uncharacterized membrane protein YhaH (DUF805 family)